MMNITRSDLRNSLISYANQLVDEIGDRADKSMIDGVKRAINDFKSDRFVMAVLGKAKRGKSTLLNVLLGRSDDALAPVDKLPASSTVSRFRRAETDRAAVVFRDGTRQEIGFQQIRDFVTEESNPGNNKGVNVVEIEGPFPGLEENLELVDTPGAGSIHEHHDAILHAFIPNADAVIFLVTARMPLDQDEIDLLRKVKAADINKVFFAINRVDEVSESDLNEAITHNRNLLARNGIQVEQVYRISAKRAFNGDLANSGVPQLMSAVASFLLSSKSKVLNGRFVSRVSDLVRPVAMSLEVEAASNNKTIQELQQDYSRLQEKERLLESESQFAEREFRLAWGRAVDDFEQGLAAARTQVDAKLATNINSISLFDVTNVAKELPTWLTKVIEDQVSPVSGKYEKLTREACERLQSSYPALDLHESGAIAVRTKEGSELITGAIGGMAAAATGVGVAVAGSAAATAITAANLAAISATTAAASSSIMSGILTWAGLGWISPVLLGTTSVAAPTALATTPLWVALAGPVGWTLAGVGVLAVPFSWRLSKIKMKDQLENSAKEQVEQVFSKLASVRIPALRNMEKGIVEEFHLRLDRQIEQIKVAIKSALERRSQGETKADRDSFKEKAQRVRTLLDKSATLLAGGDQA